MATIQLNCDLGENFGLYTLGDQTAALKYVDQANLACGFHAGDFSVMACAVADAVEHNLSIGAHPGYPDLQGFGRRAMAFSPQEVTDLMLYQMGALNAFCQTHGKQIDYVKPHGALYHAIYKDSKMLEAALIACKQFREGLPLMTLAVADPSAVKAKSEELGVPVLFEAFADRAYLADATLSPRSHPDAVHHDQARIVQQGVAIASGQPITTLEGESLTLHADTLCVHGDNPTSLAVLKSLRAALEDL